MEWREVIEHPSLQDLPFQIETNEWGEIVMTPATVRHGKYQMRIAILFERLGAGDRVLSECGIQTSDDVKVADIAWGGVAFHKRNTEDVPALSESPEIVVEIKSPSNTVAQMERKKRLFFEAAVVHVPSGHPETMKSTVPSAALRLCVRTFRSRRKRSLVLRQKRGHAFF